jgi:hypothetical protein
VTDEIVHRAVGRGIEGEIAILVVPDEQTFTFERTTDPLGREASRKPGCGGRSDAERRSVAGEFALVARQEREVIGKRINVRAYTARLVRMRSCRQDRLD